MPVKDSTWLATGWFCSVKYSVLLNFLVVSCLFYNLLHNILFLFFRITTILIYILSLGGMVAFTFTLQLQKIWIVFLMAGALG
mgnify:FL=1